MTIRETLLLGLMKVTALLLIYPIHKVLHLSFYFLLLSLLFFLYFFWDLLLQFPSSLLFFILRILAWNFRSISSSVEIGSEHGVFRVGLHMLLQVLNNDFPILPRIVCFCQELGLFLVLSHIVNSWVQSDPFARDKLRTVRYFHSPMNCLTGKVVFGEQHFERRTILSADQMVRWTFRERGLPCGEEVLLFISFFDCLSQFGLMVEL